MSYIALVGSLLILLAEPVFEFIGSVVNDGKISWAALVAGLVLWSKLKKEKSRYERAERLERRQLDIEHNIKLILDHMGIEGGRWNPTNSNPSKSISVMGIIPKTLLFLRRMNMEKLKSRKLWLAILTVIVPVINKEFNINLDTPTVIAIIGGIASAILGLAHVDHAKAKGANNEQPDYSSSDKTAE